MRASTNHQPRTAPHPLLPSKYPMQIEKIYEPQRFEPHWADWWKESGIFHAHANAPGPSFSMVIPPPNVTAALHMGPMRGDNPLWLPGTDHAGISTQVMVQRLLAEQGISRRDLGREKFEKRVWLW